MTDFSLLKQLNTLDHTDGTNSTTNIKYQQYEIVVEKLPVQINIPVRSTTMFEQKLIEIDSAKLSRRDLKLLLREFRGIRG